MLTPAGTEGLLYQGENGAFSLIECESEIGWPGRNRVVKLGRRAWEPVSWNLEKSGVLWVET